MKVRPLNDRILVKRLEKRKQPKAVSLFQTLQRKNRPKVK